MTFTSPQAMADTHEPDHDALVNLVTESLDRAADAAAYTVDVFTELDFVSLAQQAVDLVTHKTSPDQP